VKFSKLFQATDRGANIFQNSMCHLKILGAGRVTWSKFHTENLQILGATEENVVVLDLCTPDLRATAYRPEKN